MRIVVDEEKCVAAGQCVLEAEDLFDQRDEDGIVVVLDEEPSADRYEAARRARDLCPALAIMVEE
ncbi:ferredoxin [Nocardia salmonicida]|uniref:ferredoxin n=1 Tax=Nocardia salmonicida TaxID=53431 RepID=UPI00367047D9